MRGATPRSRSGCRRRYFNPRSSCEERLALVSVCIFPFTFQSTLLMRGATISITKTLYRLQFQSTLLMRGATILIMRSTPYRTISIHAPHARSDDKQDGSGFTKVISIHAPHARSDTTTDDIQAVKLFISIHAPHARSDTVVAV